MLLPRPQALQFIEGYKSVLLQVLLDTDTARSDSINDDLASARSLAKDKPGLIDNAFKKLAAEGRPVEPVVELAVRTLRVNQWVYLRQAKTFAVFLDKEIKNAYAVKALTNPLNMLVDDPPFTFEAGLFEFEGCYVCDGLVLNPVALGPGYGAQLKAAYTAIRKAGLFHATTAA
jgi:hypothetical protein